MRHTKNSYITLGAGSSWKRILNSVPEPSVSTRRQGKAIPPRMSSSPGSVCPVHPDWSQSIVTVVRQRPSASVRVSRRGATRLCRVASSLARSKALFSTLTRLSWSTSLLEMMMTSSIRLTEPITKLLPRRTCGEMNRSARLVSDVGHGSARKLRLRLPSPFRGQGRS